MVQIIEVKNISTRLTTDQLRPILSAVQDQVNEDLLPVWDTTNVQINIIAGNATWTKGGWRFFVADTPAQVNQDVQNVLGDHDGAGGAPTGYAFMGPTLDNRMMPSVTISHEILEMMGDPLIDQYCLWQNVPDSLFLAQELCDPVEDDSLAYQKSGQYVSNFVTPAFFIPGSAAPWDFGNKLSQPNSLGVQGYQIRWDPNNGISQYTGAGPGRGRASPAFATPYSRRIRRATKTQQRSQLARLMTPTPEAIVKKVRNSWGALTLAFLAGLIACSVWITLGAWHHRPNQIYMQWIAVELVLVLLCGVAGYLVNKRVDGILIDDRNRISLERTQWIAWFVVLLGTYFTIAVWNTALGQSFPTMQMELYGLLGIVSASAVTSSVIINAKKNDPTAPPPPTIAVVGTPTQQGSVDANVSPSEASWADLYLGDEVANRNYVDVSRLQKLVITVLLIMTYIQQIWSMLESAGKMTAHGATVSQISQMPNMDSTRLWLLGISHAAYLAYKATPKTASGQVAQNAQ